MATGYVIAQARPDDVHLLAAATREGRLWVATAAGQPVGFAHLEVLAPDLVHLEELDVLPWHGRRGIGTALVRAVCAWAKEHGFARVTLTTFRATRVVMAWSPG